MRGFCSNGLLSMFLFLSFNNNDIENQILRERFLPISIYIFKNHICKNNIIENIHLITSFGNYLTFFKMFLFAFIYIYNNVKVKNNSHSNENTIFLPFHIRIKI